MIRNIVFDMGAVLYHFYPTEALAALDGLLVHATARGDKGLELLK